MSLFSKNLTGRRNNSSRFITILFLAANPKDTPQLKLDEEVRAIRRKLRESMYRDSFRIEQVWAARVSEIQESLLQYKPHIVHFSGHGSGLSELVFEDAQGRSKSVEVNSLRELFSLLKHNIRCVVLNACYSDKQAKAIAEHIDCVIGMSQGISDGDAISFSGAFYHALGCGESLVAAFRLGRNNIKLENQSDDDTLQFITYTGNVAPIIHTSGIRDTTSPTTERPGITWTILLGLIIILMLLLINLNSLWLKNSYYKVATWLIKSTASPTGISIQPTQLIADPKLTTPSVQALSTVTPTKTPIQQVLILPTGTSTLQPTYISTSAPVTQTSKEAVEKFQRQGYFTVGARRDTPPFGYDSNWNNCDYKKYDQNFKPEGFDIALVHEFADRWLGNANAVRFVCVTADQRIAAVTEGKVDFIAAAFGFSPERCKELSCSIAYFEDGLALMIRKDSGISSVCDLEGKKVSVLSGTTAIPGIEKFAPQFCQYNVLPKIITTDTRDKAFSMVENKDVSAYVTDYEILKALLENDEILRDGVKDTSNLTVTEKAKTFAPERFHFGAYPKNDGLIELINLTLQEMKADGSYDAIYAKYFGCDNAPFGIIMDNRSVTLDYVKQRHDQISLCYPNNNAPPTSLQEVEHVVQPGETLGGLAIKYYSDFSKYPCIQNFNGVEDPRVMPVGQVLKIPLLANCP